MIDSISLSVAGRAAIVTGAGSRGEGIGIGKAISLTLTQAGATICLVDRESARAKTTLQLIQEHGGTGIVIGADVTSVEDCERIVAETLERCGRIEVLVNNAAITDGRTPLDPMSPSLWQDVLDVNLNGAMLMSRACLPTFIQGGGGAIVNISSLSGLVATGTAAYGASKAALNSLTRDLALMFGRSKVRVNAIAPGYVETPMLSDIVSPEAQALQRRLTPLGIAGAPWDVANSALFLASDLASFVTGVCVPVDGGASVRRCCTHARYSTTTNEQELGARLERDAADGRRRRAAVPGLVTLVRRIGFRLIDAVGGASC